MLQLVGSVASEIGAKTAFSTLLFKILLHPKAGPCIVLKLVVLCWYGNFFYFVFSILDGDPKNYMAYYRRATVYFAMGKSKSALPDLSKVIELKPDFTAVSWLLFYSLC